MLLEIRRDYRELNDLDLLRAPLDGGQTIVIDTALPPEAFEVVEEDGPGELEASEAG